MMPRLQAEEQLEGLQTLSARGHMRRGDRTALVKRLQRQAKGGQRQKGVKPTKEQLTGMNIEVVEEKGGGEP